MSKRVLRPLSNTELLDEIFDLYKSKFLLLFGISAVVFIPVYTLLFAFLKQDSDNIVKIAISLSSYVVIAATIWAVSKSYLGSDVTIGASYKAIVRRIPSLYGTLILAGLTVMLGIALLIVPGILFYFWYIFVPTIFVVEGKNGLAAMRRSKALAKVDLGRIFGFLFLTGLAIYVVTIAIALPFLFHLGFFAGHVSSSAMNWTLYGLTRGLLASLLIPVHAILITLLYYDYRVRFEGFDLDLLANSLGETAETPEIEDQPVQ